MDNKPRKRWVAGLLSLIQPGLGQIYNGQLPKAIIIYALSLVLIPGIIICLNTMFIRVFLIVLVVLVPTYYLWAIIDAIKTAGRFSSEYHPQKYNKVFAYIGIFLLAAILTNALIATARNHFIRAYKFPSTSMEPTVLMGDHILVDRREQARNPRRGDLIVFKYPKDESKDFMKRVVAVGGDTIEIRNKQLIVNGYPVKESCIIYVDQLAIPATQSPRDNFGPFDVSVNSFFVLGDNRDRSLDSRFFGVVDKSKIMGTVKSIYWSWDSQQSSVRWERIGKEVL